MPFSRRSREGVLTVDHRSTALVGGPGLVEMATITCSHCQRQMIRNPGRTRERGYCPKCDHYVCDQCEAVRVKSGECRTFKQIMDEVQESEIRKLIWQR